jgi:hypothetical protein
MAFQKSLTLPSGATGDYIRVITYRWDRSAREAVALFALYVSQGAAQEGKQALTPYVAKLRLTGAKFDQYLGNALLADRDAIAQLYAAAKVEPVSCDFGSDVFADALDA